MRKNQPVLLLRYPATEHEMTNWDEEVKNESAGEAAITVDKFAREILSSRVMSFSFNDTKLQAGCSLPNLCKVLRKSSCCLES